MSEGFNLSGWAIQRQSLIIFLVFLSAAAGVLAYVNLGRDEDPEFTFKTMIVSAGWPGGTIEQTTDQITDRLERTLEEVPHLDSLRSLTTAGQSVVYVTLDDSTPPDRVGESWYQARKKVGEKVTVEMTVQAAKDRLENRGEIYLDAEEDFRDEKNFAVVITKAGAASLKEAGIDDPAAHFKGKKLRATGTVKEVDKVPRIEIDDAKQVKLVD